EQGEVTSGVVTSGLHPAAKPFSAARGVRDTWVFIQEPSDRPPRVFSNAKVIPEISKGNVMGPHSRLQLFLLLIVLVLQTGACSKTKEAGEANAPPAAEVT